MWKNISLTILFLKPLKHEGSFELQRWIFVSQSSLFLLIHNCVDPDHYVLENNLDADPQHNNIKIWGLELFFIQKVVRF